MLTYAPFKTLILPKYIRYYFEKQTKNKNINMNNNIDILDISGLIDITYLFNDRI